jgi:hypothetical protein
MPIPDTTIRDDPECPTPRDPTDPCAPRASPGPAPRPSLAPRASPAPRPSPASCRRRSRASAKSDSAHIGTISITLRACRASWNAMKPRIQGVLTPWKPGSTASGPAPAAIHGPAQTTAAIHGRPSSGRDTVPGHFRLSGRSRERRQPVSEAGISNTTVESSSGASAFAGAGGFAALAGALAAAVVPLATVASSGAPPSDHGTAGSHGGLPLAAGLAAGSAPGAVSRA